MFAAARTSRAIVGLGMALLLAARPWTVPASAQEPAPGETESMVGEERESPPEYRSHEDLGRWAATSRDRAALGPMVGAPTIQSATLAWTELGPRPIEFDYWANGMAAGRVSAILVDPRNANVAYIAAAQGGVWKTLDGGASWTPLTDQLSSLASGALAFDPRNPDVIWYGTGEQHSSGDSYYGDGLFRSSDAGASWSKIASRASVGNFIARVAVHATHPETLYVASSLGVARSTNGGASWTRVLTGDWCYDLAFDPGNNDVIYAAIYGIGVFKSLDGGSSWSALSGGLPSLGFRRINLAVAPSNPQILYASYVAPNGSLFGMYKTLDGGFTWTPLSATPNYLGTQGWYDNCLIVDRANASTCYAGGVFPYNATTKGVIRTTDGGATWTDITTGIDGSRVHPDQHVFAWGPDGALWLGNDGGVWKTLDGGAHWINRNDGLAITQFYSVGPHPNDPDVLLGGTQDNGTERYEGAMVWPQVVTGDGGACLFRKDSPNLYYTTYVRLNPVYLWDAGSYVADVHGPWTSDRALFTQAPLVADPTVPAFLLAGTYRVWRSTDAGSSWGDLSGDLTGGTGFLYSIAVAKTGSNFIYAGTDKGRVFAFDGVSVWNDRSEGLPRKPVMDLVVGPFDEKVVYACVDTTAGGRVFRSADAGVTWASITGDLPDNLQALSFAVDFVAYPPRFYLGTDYGVYSSPDGAHWTKEAAGLPNVAVFDLAVDPARSLVAATHGRGMWRGSFPLLAVGAAPGARATIELTAENPARVPARIEYRIARAADVTLEIFDLGGRRVRGLAAGAKAAGRYAASWDGRDASGVRRAPGIYLVRVTAGDERAVRRIALIE